MHKIFLGIYIGCMHIYMCVCSCKYIYVHNNNNEKETMKLKELVKDVWEGLRGGKEKENVVIL